MLARIVVQRLPGGQVNVSITADNEVVPEDFLIGDPNKADYTTGEVLILGTDPEIETALLGTELRSVSNVDEIAVVECRIGDTDDDSE